MSETRKEEEKKRERGVKFTLSLVSTRRNPIPADLQLQEVM